MWFYTETVTILHNQFKSNKKLRTTVLISGRQRKGKESQIAKSHFRTFPDENLLCSNFIITHLAPLEGGGKGGAPGVKKVTWPIFSPFQKFPVGQGFKRRVAISDHFPKKIFWPPPAPPNPPEEGKTLYLLLITIFSKNGEILQGRTVIFFCLGGGGGGSVNIGWFQS